MTRKAAVVGIVGLLFWTGVTGATDFEWHGTCGTTNWNSTCAIGECSPGVQRLFNNWEQQSCAPAQPAFPGVFDAVVVPVSLSLGSDATVGWLTVQASGAINAGGPATHLIAQNALTNAGQIALQDAAKLQAWGGTIANDGTIVLRSGGSAGGGIFQVPTDLTMSGSGSLVLESGRVDEAAVLTNALGHTIRGGGGEIRCPLVNNGLVNADVSGGAISLTTTSKVNNGMIEASNGGDVNISATVTQSGSGQILASGTDSLVNLAGAILSGGTVATSANGKVWSNNATNFISDLTNSGYWGIQDGSTLNVIGTTLTNNGTMELGLYSGGSGWSALVVSSGVTLAGTGDVKSSGAFIRGGPFTNASTHTIHGSSGTIEAELTNDGTISGDISGGVLTLSSSAKTNNGLIRAVNGADLHVSTTVNQGAAGQILADGVDSYVVLLGGAHLTGGTVATANDGWIWSTSASTTIADLTNSGHWGVQNGAVMSVTGSTLTNDGVMELGLYTGGSGPPFLRFDSDVLVAGSGSFALSNCYLDTGTGSTFTNGSSHTIHGWGGRIRGAMVNNGTVDCDTNNTWISLSDEAKTNNGTLQASAGGDLDISTTVTQGAGGQIVASGSDSNVVLGNGAHIVGGTLTTSSDGRFWTSGVSPEVTDISNAGYWGIQNGAQPTFTGSTLTNDGTIEAGLYMGGSGPPTLHFNDPLLLGGSGALFFSGGRLATAAGVTWTNEAGHTIHGSTGSFAASMVNRGSIVADWGGGYITIYAQSPGITNEGLIQVNSGSSISINGADLFTQTAGETLVEGALNLSGGPLALQGGKLTGAGTVNGSVANTGGSVNPGASVGRLTVNGDYTQDSGGQLLVELGGTGAGEHDVLDVNGTASLNGTLYVTTADNFQPQPGDLFTILEVNTRSGAFSKVQSWVDSDCSMGFTVTYNASSVVLTAQDGAAGILCDNFEAGDADAWSHTQP